MSDYTDRDLLALDEIEDLLTAYADARLTPATPVLARMRAVVVARATASAAAAARQRRTDTDRAVGRRWGVPSFGVPRRAVSFGLAATLTLGTTAAVLAAPPGSPFYGARVAIEHALLPTNADARLVAHEDRIAALLADAQSAADSGDVVGLDAALAAYQDEVDAAVADLGDTAAANVGDASGRLAHLEAELGKHVAVLNALQTRLPSQAAIEHAIVASQKAVDKLQEKGTQGGGKPSQAPHPTHVPNTDQGQGGGNPNP